jgi:hypothetical protein
VIGLGVAADYWQKIGMERVRRYCVELQEYLFQGIEDREALFSVPAEGDLDRVISSDQWRGSGLHGKGIRGEKSNHHPIGLSAPGIQGIRCQ